MAIGWLCTALIALALVISVGDLPANQQKMGRRPPVPAEPMANAAP